MLADNTIFTIFVRIGGVRLLGNQITSPPEQHRVVLLVFPKFESYNMLNDMTFTRTMSTIL